MSEKIIRTVIQIRRDTEANWLANKDVVLKAGEPAMVLDGKNKGGLKLGDGVTTWENLPFLPSSEEIANKPAGKSYLTFSSLSSFTLKVNDVTKHWNGTLEYFAENKTWTTWDGTTTLSAVDNDEKYVLYLRGIGNTVITGINQNYKWVLTGSNIACIGNIENLLDYATVESGNHPTMANSCYYNMFQGCTSLTQAPALPATTLSNNCYAYMFNGCTSLTQAPALPAMTLAKNCYYNMFQGCTSLTQAPALPAMTLANYCYASMFYGCTSLTQAPALPAMTLANYCYQNMFYKCTSLTQAPALPATTLATYCYAYMFRGCTSLTQAPTLPATTLAEYCYSNMFYDCTSLTQAPALPVTTLADYCYQAMFRGCTALKLSTTQTDEYIQEYRIPSSGTGTTATNALSDMFKSTGGTFTGTPSINTTYYLSSDNMIVRETEIATLNGYVGSMIAEKAPVPDWNQNDDTQPDYVKNRPFYTGDPVETVLVEESTVSFSEANGLYQAEFPSTFEATVGETYKVSWDGTVYECTCVDLNGVPAIGNLSILGAGSDTGEPFVMSIMNGEVILIATADTSASHTFSISRTDVPVVKIDKKYLVQPDWNEPDSTSHAYIKNKPCYDYIEPSGVIWGSDSARTSAQSALTLVDLVDGWLIKGETYRLTVDGVETTYTCAADSNGRGLYIGTGFAVFGGGFFQYYTDATLRAYTDGLWNDGQKVRLEGPLRRYKKLDTSLYEAAAVDSTLTQTGQAADAAAVGNRLSSLSERMLAVDGTLTQTGQAADAAAVGNRLSSLSERISSISSAVDESEQHARVAQECAQAMAGTFDFTGYLRYQIVDAAPEAYDEGVLYIVTTA